MRRLSAIWLASCGCSVGLGTEVEPAPAADADPAIIDAGEVIRPDLGMTDLGVTPDLGMQAVDAGSPVIDAGAPEDAGVALGTPAPPGPAPDLDPMHPLRDIDPMERVLPMELTHSIDNLQWLADTAQLQFAVGRGKGGSGRLQGSCRLYS